MCIYIYITTSMTVTKMLQAMYIRSNAGLSLLTLSYIPYEDPVDTGSKNLQMKTIGCEKIPVVT